MDLSNILTSLSALVFVLCLMGLASLLFRKYGGGLNVAVSKTGKRRLQIKEILPIDSKKKILLISRDGKEHLIAFSDNSIEVIEKNIDEKNS